MYQKSDGETQLFYCNSRFYSPELCHWISPDSIEYLDPQSINGLNLYCYCGNDPVNRFDPSGNIGIGIVISIAFIGVGLLLLLKSDTYKEVMDEPTNHLKYTFDNGDVIIK